MARILLTTNTNQPPPLINDIATKIGEGIGQEVVVFFVLFLVISIRDYLRTKAKLLLLKKNYFETGNNNSAIKEKMIELMNLLKADRILLLELHNGDEFLSKKPQLKATLTHQYTSKGIASIDKIINLPIQYIYREIELLTEQKDFYWLLTDESYPRCKQYLKNIGVEMYGSYMFRNKLGIGYAILGVHYCSFDFLPIINDPIISQQMLTKLKELKGLLE